MARSQDEPITAAMAILWGTVYPNPAHATPIKQFPISILDRLKLGKTFGPGGVAT